MKMRASFGVILLAGLASADFWPQSSGGGGWGGSRNSHPFGGGPSQHRNGGGGYSSPHNGPSYGHNSGPSHGGSSSFGHGGDFHSGGGFPSGAGDFHSGGGGGFEAPKFENGFGDDHECPYGYRYSSWSGECKDRDECLEGGHTCNANTEICYNTKGSFACVPKPPCEKPTCQSLGFDLKQNTILNKFNPFGFAAGSAGAATLRMLNTFTEASAREAASLPASNWRGILGSISSGFGAVLTPDDCCLLCAGTPGCKLAQFVRVPFPFNFIFNSFTRCYLLGEQFLDFGRQMPGSRDAFRRLKGEAALAFKHGVH